MRSQTPAALTVSTFPNAKALPLWAAVEINLFERFGLDVTLDETESSDAQRRKLVSGEIHIVQAAIDNALALIKDGEDVVVFMGGEPGMNDFVVQADIQDFIGMKGRVLLVDSPDTAYALQARKLLAKVGLKNGVDYTVKSVGNASRRLAAMLDDRSYGGAVLNPPFSSAAQLAGMKSLGRLTDLLGPYQAGGAFGLRSWAASHEQTLESYMKGYVTALRWLTLPRNKPIALDLLTQRLTVTKEVAEIAFGQLIDSSYGFTPDAKIDMIGVRNMIATRAETEGAGAATFNPDAFIDLTYYRRAMSDISRPAGAERDVF